MDLITKTKGLMKEDCEHQYADSGDCVEDIIFNYCPWCGVKLIPPPSTDPSDDCQKGGCAD
jgi:hypothetical protein